ncbi:hypothetical protein DLREEDagrD3_12650 [Denitratisoma sp. agr-D3]
MAWDPEKFRRWFRNELRDYLADVRDIIDALRHAEGWVALGLILAVLSVVAVWFITGLGFGGINVEGSLNLGSRHCRPISNFSGVVMFVDVVMMFLFGIMAIGEMLQVLERLRLGDPPQHRWVVLLTLGMLVSGVAGIVYMRIIC